MRGDYGSGRGSSCKDLRGRHGAASRCLYWRKTSTVPGNVDWQDAAVEFRKIMPTAQGMEETPDAVVQRLVFPSREGNYPYVASLDETKRVYLNTDGLGQLVLKQVS